MATNGVLTGSPAGSDTGANEWEFIVTDGTASATGTLYIAVKLVSVVQVETFDGAAFQNADPQVWTFDKATTAISNGTWIGNWSLPKFTTPGGDSQLRLYTPNNGNAIATRSLLLDETLFTGGAGTYVLQFELEDLTLSGTTLYIDLYDVSLDGGGSVDIDSYFWWDLNSYAGLPGIVTNIAPATAGLITNLSWVGMTEGIETAEFDYDGSGDVLINIGASKPSTAGTDWWRIHLDDFYVYSFVEVGYDLWVTGYGLNGTNAAATYDYDGDGWENLLEYGLGLNPTNDLADGGAYPTFTQEASGMAYVHAQRTDDPSLTYSLLTKTDLISGEWTETGYPVSTNLTGGTYNYITNSIPTTDPRKFIRLKIEQSP